MLELVLVEELVNLLEMELGLAMGKGLVLELVRVKASV